MDSKLLVPELNEAEAMGGETARFEELLLQVRTDQGYCVPEYLVEIFVFRDGISSQSALGRQQGPREL